MRLNPVICAFSFLQRYTIVDEAQLPLDIDVDWSSRAESGQLVGTVDDLKLQLVDEGEWTLSLSKVEWASSTFLPVTLVERRPIPDFPSKVTAEKFH